MQLAQFLHPLVDQYIAHGPKGLSSYERQLVAAWLGDSEVHTGGFEQFYLNATGELAVEFAAALKAISATDKAAIVERANQLFGDKPPQDHQQRQQSLEQQIDSEKLKSLTKKYLASNEDVKRLLHEFTTR